ncbi:MAG: amidohydrolase family protein [Gammaproteobacteria bacterium]|jgi:imidazolonepropionase-like amidohydrolase|nr:amidohydrolase family protein [Gammaproteobacteria bacterium]
MLRILMALLFGLTSAATFAQTVLIENVRIFNGVDRELKPGHVLVVDGIIDTVSGNPIDAPAGASVLDGGNRVLSPGFIDLHTHLAGQNPRSMEKYHPTVAGANAAAMAKHYLDSGFTTIRDAGGTHPDFARAIEAGLIYGPRLFPSGAVISQTAGHGDFRAPHDPHPTLVGGSPYLSHGEAVLADGVDQTLMAARENLKAGATQIKIMGGGGVMSEYDPIHSLQPSPAEIRAAVQAAGDWGTYVLAHAYTSAAIERLVVNGVKCIEHGLLIDDKTAKLVADNGVVISTQLVIYRTLQDLPGINERNLRKLEAVLAGQENLIRLIKKYDIKTGFATDFIQGGYTMLTREFTERAEYWSPAEIMVQATSESAEVIRMIGKLNRWGNFGEIREGWVADLLLINGEPLEDISVLREPETALAMIMKQGEIVKLRL